MYKEVHFLLMENEIYNSKKIQTFQKHMQLRPPVTGSPERQKPPEVYHDCTDVYLHVCKIKKMRS